MSLSEKIDTNRVPSHVAVIMDGNGRWAKKRGLQRVFGHNEGVGSLNEVLEAADDIGVKYLTVYAFSSENWNRPRYEVDAIMMIISRSIKKEFPRFMQKNVRFRTIGDNSRLSKSMLAVIADCTQATANNTGITLQLALSYGSRAEIVDATRRIAEAVQAGTLKPEDVNESTIGKNLYTSDIPDPELLIRTSGEYRISNFLLWQIAYAELYFTPLLWPEFRRENFFEAILDYQSRERRFGKTSEQVTDNES